MARRDFGGAASIINRSPSFRMMASFPGSSNSRGMRTAWFLPFLNSLTCCSRTNDRRLIGICHSICQSSAFVNKSGSYYLPGAVPYPLQVGPQFGHLISQILGSDISIEIRVLEPLRDHGELVEAGANIKQAQVRLGRTTPMARAANFPRKSRPRWLPLASG